MAREVSKTQRQQIQRNKDALRERESAQEVRRGDRVRCFHGLVAQQPVTYTGVVISIRRTMFGPVIRVRITEGLMLGWIRDFDPARVTRITQETQ